MSSARMDLVRMTPRQIQLRILSNPFFGKIAVNLKKLQKLDAMQACYSRKTVHAIYARRIYTCVC